jgi:hypothetical protein
MTKRLSKQYQDITPNIQMLLKHLHKLNGIINQSYNPCILLKVVFQVSCYPQRQGKQSHQYLGISKYQQKYTYIPSMNLSMLQTWRKINNLIIRSCSHWSPMLFCFNKMFLFLGFLNFVPGHLFRIIE